MHKVLLDKLEEYIVVSDRIIYNPRQKRKKSAKRRVKMSRPKKYAMMGGVLLLLLAGGVIELVRLPWWQVSKFQITGVASVPESMLTDALRAQMQGAYAKIFPRTFIGTVSTHAIEQVLVAEFPIFEYVHVLKKYPKTLAIEAKERQFLGIACSRRLSDGGQAEDGVPRSCAYVDMNGVAYETAPSSSGLLIRKIIIDIPDITKGTKVVDPEVGQSMRTFTDGFARATRSWVTQYELLRRVPRELRAHTSDGYYIIFQSDDDLDNVLRVVQTVLQEDIKNRKSQLEYIDARFGNKVFYKFK